MGAAPVAAQPLLSETELVRTARILARYLAGRRLSSSGAETAGRLAGRGREFLDFREYQPGDDFRSIDWRVSARSNAIQVRRYCTDLASDWYLCVDSSASMSAHGGANWLLARQLAVALAYVLLHLGHRVGLLLFSGEIDAACALGRGQRHYARILRTLSSHSSRSSGSVSDPAICAALVGQSNPLIIVSDFLAEDAMVTALANFHAGRRGLHLFQLDGLQEWQLPTANSLRLEDIETGQSLISADPEAAQASARMRLAVLHQDLANWCSRYRVPLTLCRSDEYWRDLLLRHFIPG